ncbi:MAG: glutathione transferase [Pseudomonadota bacterium]
MPDLTLYVDAEFASPWAMAVYVALLEKKLPFALKVIDLDAGESKQPPFRDLSVSGRVPTLVHGDFVLAESSAIIEYLDEVFPAPHYAALLPADVQRRAQARQVQAWIRSDNQAVRVERNTHVIFFGERCPALSEAGQAAAARLIRIAERLVDGAHLFGSWSIADVDLALMLHRLILNGDPVPQRLKDYAAAQWQRASVQQWMAQPRASLT